MSERVRKFAVFVLVLLLVLAACSKKAPGPTTSAFRGSGASPSVRSSSSGSTPKGDKNNSQKPAPSPVPSELTKGQELQPGALEPTSPGQYKYDESGNRTFGGCGIDGPPPSPTTLQVDAADKNRQRSVRDRRAPSGVGEVVTSLFEFDSDGIYLVYLLQEQYSALGRNSIEFRPNPPVKVFPLDSTQSFSFSMTSTDGKVTYSAQNTVESKDDSVVLSSGEKFSAVRIHRVGHIVGESIAGHVDVGEEDRSWIAKSARIIVKQVTDTRGTIGACEISTHDEALLRSSRPS